MKKKLRGQHVYLISSLLIAVFVVFGLLFQFSQSKLLKDITETKISEIRRYFEKREMEEHERLRVRADFITGSIAKLSSIQLENSQTFNLQKEGIESTLEPFMDYSEVAGIEVTDRDNKPYAAIWRDNGKLTFRTSYSLPSAFRHRYGFVVTKPAISAHQKQGSVSVYVDDLPISLTVRKLKAELDEFSAIEIAKLQRHFRNSFSIQVLLLIISSIFVLLLSSMISRSYRKIEKQGCELEALNRDLEKKVEERTSQLRQTQANLVRASRLAGMSEVATGILHNVGNVLNSVNVSAEMINRYATGLQISSLQSLIDLLKKESADLPSFLANDERGKKLLPYLETLTSVLTDDRKRLVDETVRLSEQIEHIKTVVQAQQKYGKMSSVIEEIDLWSLIEELLVLCRSITSQAAIDVDRASIEGTSLKTDRHKVLQILINLVQNAIHAVRECPEKNIHIEAVKNEQNQIMIRVRDTGVGIAKEDITKIFAYGYTTKKDGHGTGLHVSALAAEELGGGLQVESDGPGRGAQFVLSLPLS